MKKVLIIQEVMKQYRLPFYDKLYEMLGREGIALTVAYSDPGTSDRQKQDHVELPDAYGLKIKATHFFGGKLVFQRALGKALESDLVIVEHANKHLTNFVLIALAKSGSFKMAFWGHGKNFQSENAHGWKERFKKSSSNWVDWWFAYTEQSANIVASNGFPVGKVTNVQNAIDTELFRTQVTDIDAIEKSDFRKRHQIEEQDFVAIFCGSLYASKQLDFLLDSSAELAKRHTGFKLLIVGAGPEVSKAKEASEQNGWCHYLGPLFGRDKALAYACSTVNLNPGLVGLGILDSFVAGVPFVTTDYPFHSPEVDYLDHGVNGLMVSFDHESFVAEVSRLITQPSRLTKMKEQAVSKSLHLTIENMASNYCHGVLAALR